LETEKAVWKMLFRIRSLGLHGVTGYEVTAECDLSGGLPNFDIVGLPDAAVKEARDRVRAAIKNSGFTFPVSRITVNLAPAHLRKAGTVYDLPILMGILAAGGQTRFKADACAFVGELSLSGNLLPVTGMLPMALAARRAGIEELYVPESSAAEATLAGGLAVYPVRNVPELVKHLKGEERIAPAPVWTADPKDFSEPDFSEVKGQEGVKRALEIAAAGGHNIAMIGPPGSGKSMLARRLPSILPDMTRDEALEATEIHSVMGLTSREQPLLPTRPFRNPHHTISAMGLAGGGNPLPRPGEISLAHNGVLFLDELPEFHKDVLESLRQPLEEGQVTVTRAAGNEVYPSRFMLVCAMNPCKCGWYGHPGNRCRCSPADVERYLGKLSGPFLDRIDLFVEVPALEYEELAARPRAETSADIRARVNAARALQSARFGPEGPRCNAGMGQKELQEHCALDAQSQALMKSAFDRLGLTARSYDRILRVGRTIADLEGSRNIEAAHLAEAVQYRASKYLRR
jgi:magnesium chelatase family protein